eukprot:SAG11_NODE_11699_length_743_cov_1.237578_1_plen_32_part_01
MRSHVIVLAAPAAIYAAGSCVCVRAGAIWSSE